MRTIIEVSAINFELRSEDEQMAITQNFQKFINSIDFPLHISIISRKIYINKYLKLAEEATSELDNELLRIQAAEYIKFVEELSSLTNIMSKKFYITVPFYVFESPSKTGFIQSLKSTVKPIPLKDLTPERFDLYKNQLMQRAELVFGGLISLGLRTRQLERDELVETFYNLYNPAIRAQEEKKV